MTHATDPTRPARKGADPAPEPGTVATPAPGAPRPLGVVTVTRQQRVLVVDDSPITRAGLCALVDGLPGSRVVGAATDARGAVDALRHLAPDVALVNVRRLTAGRLATLARSAPSHTAVVVVRTPASALTFDDARDARISGLVDLDVVEEDLRTVLEVAGTGHSFCLLSDERLGGDGRAGHDSSPRSPSCDRDAAGLTAREQQVLGLVARGLSNRQVASDLRISEGTVKKHVTRLLGKLNVQSRTQAALTSVRRREPEPSDPIAQETG